MTLKYRGHYNEPICNWIAEANRTTPYTPRLDANVKIGFTAHWILAMRTINNTLLRQISSRILDWPSITSSHQWYYLCKNIARSGSYTSHDFHQRRADFEIDLQTVSRGCQTKRRRSKEILTLLRQRKEANVLLVYAFIYNPYKIGKIRIHQTEKSA